MLPFEKIACPIDFSEPSYAALDAAVELAIHFTAELLLIHVVPVIPTLSPAIAHPRTFEVGAYQADLNKSSQKAMDDLIKQRLPTDLPVFPMVVPGDAATEIVRITDDCDVNLIVIATHGHTGWRRLVFGSVTEKVVRMASRPVLTIQAPHGPLYDNRPDQTRCD